jgi:hypothetical protein
MDFSQSPLHPQLPALLEKLGLRAVDAANWNVLLCTPAEGTMSTPTLVLKYSADSAKSEIIAYETKVMSIVLPTIDQRLFERLALPEYVNDGEDGGLRWLLTRNIPGKQLIHDWSEFSFKPEKLGGKRIHVSVAKDAVDVLRDLRSVDIVTLPDVVRRFSLTEWIDGFRARADEMVKLGLLEPAVAVHAESLLKEKRVERYEGTMFTNGDFYPRNYIMLTDHRIAVTDWVGGIDPWEFVAMYAWLMMWGNPVWQVEYINELKKHFPVDVEEMRIGLLVKSFDRAYRWRTGSEEFVGAARAQMMSYFRQSLDGDYVRELFA